MEKTRLLPLINNINLFKTSQFDGKTGQSHKKCLKLYKKAMAQKNFSQITINDAQSPRNLTLVQ